MASYKHANLLMQSTSDEFDKDHNPGVAAPFAGIYRCTSCGHEIGIAEGHTLPSQNHPRHKLGTPIRWRLVIFAMHNK